MNNQLQNISTQEGNVQYVDERVFGRPFYGRRPYWGYRPFYGYNRPFYGGFGGPFLGGVLGGLLGSTLFYPPYGYGYGGYGYPPYYGGFYW
ncbi:hypothetical protein [Ornithinibacillus xuwenensis]|uniref:Spore coat protein n=1 Tax=Ornithinibacillus xuwenensis TaxID=3144668 RepID=A0ABU9XDF8_9BACI